MSPDVAAEFATPVCPQDSDLRELVDLLSDNFLPDFDAPRQRFAACARREALNTNVVTIGLWIGRDRLTEAEMRTELTGSPLLTAGHTCALRVFTSCLQTVAEAEWAKKSKKSGRVTLDEQITVRVSSGRIVTKVMGTYDPPLFIFPDVDFTYTITDTIELEVPEFRPPLRARSDTNVDAGTPGVLAATLIVGLVSQILGGILFFVADSIAESQAPAVSSLGSTLASQWPSEILTSIKPPFLPGKFSLSWTDLIVDQEGVLTSGTFSPEARSPDVLIVGPRRVTVREAVGQGVGRYRIDPRDLRSPLTTRWGGAGHGTEPSLAIPFTEAGVFPLDVSVTDADGLTDTSSTSVQVSFIPLEPGQQPF